MAEVKNGVLKDPKTLGEVYAISAKVEESLAKFDRRLESFEVRLGVQPIDGREGAAIVVEHNPQPTLDVLVSKLIHEIDELRGLTVGFEDVADRLLGMEPSNEKGDAALQREPWSLKERLSCALEFIQSVNGRGRRALSRLQDGI